MHVLSICLIHKADEYIDENHNCFAALGEKMFEQFGSDKGKTSTQVRNLQRITCSTTRFSDIEDFVKNQMGKGDKTWMTLGDDILRELSKLRDHSDRLDDDETNRMALRLRLARGWVQAVVGEYLYRLAREQMRGSA